MSGFILPQDSARGGGTDTRQRRCAIFWGDERWFHKGPVRITTTAKLRLCSSKPPK
jgi:hypothetical protein